MTRSDWTGIAVALSRLRAQLLKHAAVAAGSDNRTAHVHRADGVMLAARTICRTLRRQSSRFDGRRFMSLVRT